MRAVRTKAWKREIRRANQAQWDRYLTDVARWPFKTRWKFAWLVLFPPARHRKSAAEQKIIEVRKERRSKRKGRPPKLSGQ